MSLYAIDTQGAKVTRVAAEPDAALDQCGSPSWTRDGKRILFDAQPRNRLVETRLRAIDLEPQGLKLTDLGPGNCPTPSPSGDRVVFLLNPGQMRDAEIGVWIMQRDGSDGKAGRIRPAALVARRPPVPDHQLREVARSDGDRRPARDTQRRPADSRSEGLLDPVLGRRGHGRRRHRRGRRERRRAHRRVQSLRRPGEAGPLEAWEGPEVKPSEPVYSPITRRCVFVGEDTKGMALYLLEPGKPGPPKRMESASDNLIRDLAFSPDGRYVLFSRIGPIGRESRKRP